MLIRFVKIDLLIALQEERYWIYSSFEIGNILSHAFCFNDDARNLVAFGRQNVNRFCYSSIAHARGYKRWDCRNERVRCAANSHLFFMYLFMKPWSILICANNCKYNSSENIADTPRIGYKAPIISVCMVIFLYIINVATNCGFIGKLYIFMLYAKSGFHLACSPLVC
jgi:NADH:ubiquinone oxidoreductase subunit 2 (subunit N)